MAAADLSCFFLQDLPQSHVAPCCHSRVPRSPAPQTARGNMFSRGGLAPTPNPPLLLGPPPPGADRVTNWPIWASRRKASTAGGGLTFAKQCSDRGDQGVSLSAGYPDALSSAEPWPRTWQRGPVPHYIFWCLLHGYTGARC